MISINEFLAKKHAGNANQKLLIYQLNGYSESNFTKIDYENSILSKVEPFNITLERLNKCISDDPKQMDVLVNDFLSDIEDCLEVKTSEKHYCVFGLKLEKLKNKSYYKNDMLKRGDDIHLFFKIKNYSSNLRELYILLK